MNMNKTIIVTGIAGFVGFNLKSYLKKSFEVIGVSRNEQIEMNVYGYGKVDEILNKSKAFIHLAGKAHDLKNIANDLEYFEINTELTKSLFDKFLLSKCNVFIYMSSVKAVADIVNGVLNEEVVPNPITAYGKSKLAAENYILSKKIPPNKKVYILRPCMIHGPGNKGNLNLLYKFVSKGLPYPLASFDNKRSFLSIDNLCFIVKELIEQDNIASGIYNVSDDEALSTNEVVSLFSNVLNKAPKLLHIPKKLISLIAKIGDTLKLPLNTERLGKLTENYQVSNQKIKEVLKKALPLSAREGILKTAEAIKND